MCVGAKAATPQVIAFLRKRGISHKSGVFVQNTKTLRSTEAIFSLGEVVAALGVVTASRRDGKKLIMPLSRMSVTGEVMENNEWQ